MTAVQKDASISVNRHDVISNISRRITEIKVLCVDFGL